MVRRLARGLNSEQAIRNGESKIYSCAANTFHKSFPGMCQTGPITVTSPASASGRKLFLSLLLIGVIARLICLNHPIFDNSNLRQTQTAEVTKGIIASGSPSLFGNVKWMGDAKAPLLLELPLYNYLVIGANKLFGNLDWSGKIVSVFLWALSFMVLQRIWSRLLDKEETFWANFLFVFAPLSLYFGQAFLPEMLIQFVSFGFIAVLLLYLEKQRFLIFCVLATTGLIGMLLKAPEVAHLYLLAAIMIAHKERTAAVGKLRYWIALALTLGVMRLWSTYIDRVNSPYFPEWTSNKVLQMMLGTWGAHFSPFGYFRLLIYIVLFAATAGGALWVSLGFIELLKNRKQLFMIAWIGSMVFAYFIWAGGAYRIHSYYNLPVLGPVCLLFGIGCSKWLSTERRILSRPVAQTMIVVLLLSSAFWPYVFLYQNDNVLDRACAWLRTQTAPDDIILVRINHRTDMCRYRHDSTVSYYADRGIWCWVDDLGDEQKRRAILTSKWALVTKPPHQEGVAERLRQWVKALPLLVEDMSWLETRGGFEKFYENDEFTIYKKGPMLK